MRSLLTDKGNLYFRIQMIDANGATSYSPLRVINLGNGSVTAFSIYPNPPSTFINLTFPGEQPELGGADLRSQWRPGTAKLFFQHQPGYGEL
jgi:hypothetical protein